MNKKPGELSFTIFETIVAVGLLMAFTLEMAGGQGSVVSKVEYARHSNNAVWLAKRIMAQVEYNYQVHELKELDLITPLRDQPFKIEGETDFEYTYTVDVREWKFPLFDFLLKGGNPDEDEDKEAGKEAPPDNAPAGALPGIEAVIDNIFKGHVMKVAHVEVSWPDGARRDSVGLTYLLTNSKALDEYLISKRTVWEGVIKKMSGAAADKCPPLSVLPSDGAGAFIAGDHVQWLDGSRRFANGTLFGPDGKQMQSVSIPGCNQPPDDKGGNPPPPDTGPPTQ